MAKENIIKTIFAIDGETKYRDAIKAINSEQSLLRAEMGRVERTYKENGDAIQLNRDKIRILNSQIELQTQKVNESRHALEQAKNAKDVDRDAVTKYTAEVIRAENGLARMESELKAANTELEKQHSKLVKAGNSMLDFSKKAKNFGEPLEKAGRSLNRNVTAPLLALGGISVKAAIDFETAMTGVRKTTELTDAEFDAMSQSIRDMAKEIPATTEEIGAIAEAAGQLGIKKENILDFTRTIIDLGVSSNITGDEGAMMLAKFANITQMPQDSFDRLGSVIVHLGNNTATTERDIAELATRLAAAGKQAGMSEADIMGYAAALSSAGMEAQAGGTAISRVLKDMQIAAETGGEALDNFASVAGMSADDFKKAFQEDAAGALAVFIAGLQDTERNGKSAVQILEDIGIKEVRTSDALLRLAGSGDVLTESIAMANQAWIDNTALTAEAELFYGTTANQLLVQKNRMEDVAITLGQQLIPHLTSLMEWLTGLVENFNELDPATQKTIITVAGLVAGLGPLLSIVGKTSKTVASLSETFGKLIVKIGEKKVVEGASDAIGGLGDSAGKAASSIGTKAIGAGLVAALAIAATYLITTAIEAAKGSEAFQALAAQVERSEKAFGNAIGDIDASASAAGSLADQIYALSAEEDKSAAQKEVLRQKIKELNELYPGLNLYIEEESGLLNLSRDAVDDYVEARKNQQLLEAYGAREVELLKEQIALEGERAAAVNRLRESQEQGFAVWDEGEQKWKQTWREMGYLGSETDEAIATFNRANDALESNAEQQAINAQSQQEAADAIAAANEKKAASAEDSADRQGDAAADAANATSEYGQAQLDEQKRIQQEQEDYYSALQTAIAKHNRIMGGLEDEGVKKSELTGSQLIANWNAQADDYEAWSLAMQGIAGKVPQGLYDELKEAGPRILPALQDMNNMSEEELQAMVDAWTRKSQLAVDGAVEELSHMPGAAGEEGKKTVKQVTDELFKMRAAAKKEGAGGGGGFATSFGEQAPKAKTEAGKVKDSALTGLSSVLEFFGTGGQSAGSYVSGILAKVASSWSAGWQLADAHISGIRARNQQQSPSKVLTGLGDEAGGSYVGGVKRNIADAKAAGEALAQATLDPLSDIRIPSPELDAQIAAARRYGLDLDVSGGAGSVDHSKHTSFTVNIEVKDGATIETGQKVARGFVEELTRERMARGETI